MKPKHDLETYEKMSAPYATKDEAAAAVEKFLDGVRALRIECRIPEVLMIATAYVAKDDGRDSVSMCGQHGDSQHSPMLAAALYSIYALPFVEKAREIENLARTTTPTEGGE